MELTSSDVNLPVADDMQPQWSELYQYAQNELLKEGDAADGGRTNILHSRIEELLSQRHAADRLAHEVALQGTCCASLGIYCDIMRRHEAASSAVCARGQQGGL